jgi:hypothetical protein
MANRYWVGGADNWNATAGTKWALTSGGAGGQAVPTSTDDVFFDGASGAVTVTVSATANCQNLDFTGFTGTFAGSSALNIYGNLVLVAGMTRTYSGTCTFRATSGTKTITSNGKSWTSGTTTFNGSGGTFQLVDQFESVGSINLTAGTFSANSQTVLLNGTGTTHTITGAFTFYNLTIGGTSAEVTFSANCTISNTFSITATTRVLVRSDTPGTARTLTVATNSLQYADFRDITGAGAGSWNLSAITGLSGDCGGNSGITFTTGATQYWYTTTTGVKTWSTAGNWFLGSGGTGGAGRVPLAQDDVIFDASSIGAGSTTVRADMARLGKTINWTGVTNTPTFSTQTSCSIFGSLTLVSGMVLATSSNTFTITFSGRSTYTLTSAGLTFGNIISLSAPGGSLTIQDNLTTTEQFGTSYGDFYANNFNVTCFRTNFNTSNTRIVSMGSGTWTLSATSANIWSIVSTITLQAGTSTIKITSTSGAITFAGSSQTYNNLWFDRGASTASITITGSATFNDFKNTGTAGHSILFTAGITTRVQTFTVSGTVGNLITINSTSTAVHYLVKTTPGQISCDYLNIQHSIASGANVWYAGLNSTNNQGVATAGEGWVFSTPKQLSGFFGAM